jgi:hypothetical protein
MVSVVDVQRVVSDFNGTNGQCAFNSNLDIVADSVVNILDLQSVLDRVGHTAPLPA